MTHENTYQWSDYEYDIVHAALPWIAFAILAFLLLIIAIVVRFLRCMCCKQQLKERGRCIKLTCVTLAFIVTFVSLLACSFIIYYSDQTFQSIQQVQCAAGKFPYVLKKGNMDKGWGGMDLLKEDSFNVTMVLEGAYNESTLKLWKESDWLTDSTFTDVLQGYYEEYNESTVTSSYPYNTNYIPTLYTSNLGPLTKSQTNTGKIFTEYSQKVSPIVNHMEEIKKTTVAIQKNLKQVISNSKAVEEKIEGYKNGTDEVNDNVHNWIVDYMPQIKTSWRGFTFWVVVWGWFICIGVLITVYSQAMGKHGIAHGLCCFWLFAGMVAVIGFLASAGTLAVGLVTRDSCQLIDDLFTKKGMSKYDLIIPTELVPLTECCILDSGDLIPVLNLTEFLSAFQGVSDNYTSLGPLLVTKNLSYFSSIQENFVSISEPINYSNVPNTSVFDFNKVDYNLNDLNKFTNNYTAGSYQNTCVEEFSDFWVLNKSKCGSYSYTAATTPKVNFGKKNCLWVTEWKLGNINARYNNIDCSYSNKLGNYSEIIYEFIKSIQGYVDSVDDLYSSMRTNLTQVNETLTNLVVNLQGLYVNIGEYLKSPEQILYLMESTVGKSGLSHSLNCALIQSYKSEIKISMCDNSLENAYQVFVFVFLLSFLMLIIELVNLYLSRALLKGIEIY